MLTNPSKGVVRWVRFMLSYVTMIICVLYWDKRLVSNPSFSLSSSPSRSHHHIWAVKSVNNSAIISSSDDVRIAFQFHDPNFVPLDMSESDRGGVGGGCKDGSIPPSLMSNNHGRVLDFTTTIQTDLHILQIGDSVMRQLSRAFDDMSGGRKRRRDVMSSTRKNKNDHNVRPGGLSTVVDGGGINSYWGMTGLLSSQGYAKAVAYRPGGGWNMQQVHTLKNETQNSGRDTFDAVVLRVMHGWMEIEEITYDRLVEAVKLSHELFGTTTVILMTIPFTNNVNTPEVWEKCNEANDWMRQIAAEWNTNSTKKHQEEAAGGGDELTEGGVESILVMEYAQYYNHIIWSNARHLGYNVSDPLHLQLLAGNQSFANEQDFLFERLKDGKEWPPSIAMVCFDKKLLESSSGSKCNRNQLFEDGMHICPKTLASRFGAGLACLLGCVYNGKRGNGTDVPLESEMRSCEHECNSQFMSVSPINEAWIDSDFMASRAN